MFALANAIKKFCGAFSKATEGTGRVALCSPFLLLAFLCGYLAKEKRLNGFAIKGLLTLFSLKQKPPSFLSDLRQPFANAKPKVKKAFQKRNGVFSPTRRAPLLVESHLLKKVDENFFNRAKRELAPR